MMPRRDRVIWAWFGAVVSIALVVGQAHAAHAGTGALNIREAKLTADGAVRLVVSVPGSTTAVGASDFTVSEAGAPVTGFTVTPLVESTQQLVSVALLVDVSGSTAGRPISDAKAAATRFVSLLAPTVRVEVIAFGQRATIAQRFTTDRAALARAIGGLRAAGETALYDAVVLGLHELRGADSQRNIVLFSDGADTVSHASLATVLTSLKDTKTPVTVVGLKTHDYDAKALGALAGAAGGRVLAVAGSGNLADAFRQAAADIASQYVISYSRTATEPKELDLAVALLAGGASDHVVVLNPRTGAPAAVAELPAQTNRPPVSFFATKTGLYVGLGGGFLAALLLLAMIFVRPETSQTSRLLRVLRKGGMAKAADDEEMRTGIASALGVAAELVDMVPTGKARDERLRVKLERSGWPLRASEFRAIQVVAALAGGIIGIVLVQKVFLGVVLAVAGFGIPMLVLANRNSKRTAAFVGQLPDTLELLAGSLQAGYSFMQGLDTLVTEAPSPTSEEFSRVLSESRLGMSVEDAMEGMADRIGSDDFRWVVLAVNIQRQVGGNLAVLLKTVATTLRDRENVRRQIKVLSAEGRLSGGILVALPFGLAGYITLVNPGYINALFHERLGQMMIAGAIFMMGLGILWIRKLIRIEV